MKLYEVKNQSSFEISGGLYTFFGIDGAYGRFLDKKTSEVFIMGAGYQGVIGNNEKYYFK